MQYTTRIYSPTLCVLLISLFTTLVSWRAIAVVGGMPADVSGPSVIMIQTSAGACTGSVIGPRVILTSASCVSRQQTARIELGNTGGTCQMYPGYSSNVTADFALCVADQALSAMRIESMPNDKLGPVASSLSVQIAGYGCAELVGPSAPVGTPSQISGKITQLPKDGYLWMMIAGVGLCRRDSGAGALLTNSDGYRYVVGVASLSDGQDMSWFSRTDNEEFLDWASNWSKTARVEICGVSKTTAACTVPAGSTSSISNRPLPPSELIQVTFSRGQTFRKGIEDVCGPKSNEYIEAYFRLLSTLEGQPGSISSVDQVIERNTRVNVPHCVQILNPPVRKEFIKAGTQVSPLAYFRQVSAATGWQGYYGRSSSKVNRDNSQSYLEVFQMLNPGVILDQPVSGDTVIFVPTRPPRDEMTRPGIVRSDYPLEPEFSSFSLADPCKSPPDPNAFPYDVSALLQVLELNLIDGHNRQPYQATVAVLDSGLYEAGVTPFYGSAVIREQQRPITPLDDSIAMAHGTEVASLILGGPLFSRLQLFGPRRIQLDIIRIYHLATFYAESSGSPYQRAGYGVDFDQLSDFLVRRASFADIVNLSIKSRNKMDYLVNKLGPDSQTLYVVAAGNNDGEIGKTPASKVYPALYGADLSRNTNLVVVVALDGDGTVWGASNSGARYAQLGAYGCGVPVLFFDAVRNSWSVERSSGTSVAAPLAAFAAAMIESEHGRRMRPSDVKLRLLVSSDLDAARSSAIEDGRALNLVKAANIFNDSVELTTAPKLLVGYAQFYMNDTPKTDEAILTFDCGGPTPTEVAIRDIYKLTPHYLHDPERPMKMYYRGDDGSMLTAECKVPDNVSISIQDRIRSEGHVPYLAAVRDFVRKMETP
jgi:Subtilase family/Trypsin